MVIEDKKMDKFVRQVKQSNEKEEIVSISMEHGNQVEIEKILRAQFNEVEEIHIKVANLPYNLPESYSLDSQITRLSELSKGTQKLMEHVRLDEAVAISHYWRKIGEYLNGAIREVTGVCQ